MLHCMGDVEERERVILLKIYNHTGSHRRLTFTFVNIIINLLSSPPDSPCLADYNMSSGTFPSVLASSKIQAPSFFCSGRLGSRERSPESRVPMELFQGEKPTHDFLSLRAGGSSPFRQMKQGYGLGPHNFLKPLEPAKKRDNDGATGDAGDGAVADLQEHMLPGGVGTFSIRQVPDTQLREEAAIGRDAIVAVPHGSRMGIAYETGSGVVVPGAPSTLWQDSGIDQRSREGRSSGSSADQEPSSPRSKHSATEQRRRTKINDRLEILRELLPHCDQKRDKASFLMEVIEYIRFLQEKVHKYESANPEKNQVESKSMPWAKVYYRSCWKNTQNMSQVHEGGLSATTEDMKKEQYSSKGITVAPASLFSTQSVRETSTAASYSHNVTENITPSNQPPWLRMSTMNQDCDARNRMLSKDEGQCLHDDTQSLSNAYSQGLFNKLTEALKKSGVDPSQANISVEINMDRRARANANIHDSSKANESKEPIHITKRPRCNRS